MTLDEQNEELVGDVTLFERILRKRVNGKVTLELKCENENERVELLEKYFGIQLRDIERRGIVGREAHIS